MSSSLESKEVSRGSLSGEARAPVGLHSCAWEEYLSEALAASGIEVALDAGANLGQHGALLRSEVAFHGRIVSLEPLPGEHQEAQRHYEGAADLHATMRFLNEHGLDLPYLSPLSIDHGLLQVLEYDALFVNRQQGRRLLPHQ